MTKSRDTELTTGLMAESTKVTGMMESNMERVNSQIARESVRMGNGTMESVFVG